jgi:sec-independent protein translocase protein TatA
MEVSMGGLGWQELLIILVIVVIIFGGARIAGVGKASGRAIREFKDELKGTEPDGLPAAPPETTPAEITAPTTPPGDTGTH